MKHHVKLLYKIVITSIHHVWSPSNHSWLRLTSRIEPSWGYRLRHFCSSMHTSTLQKFMSCHIIDMSSITHSVRSLGMIKSYLKTNNSKFLITRLKNPSRNEVVHGDLHIHRVVHKILIKNTPTFLIARLENPSKIRPPSPWWNLPDPSPRPRLPCACPHL
jgi:hypothetical protein